MPSDSKHRRLPPAAAAAPDNSWSSVVRSTRANMNRTAPVQATRLAWRFSRQPDARTDTLALLRPAALAQMARPQPFRGIAEFADEPQDKAPDRKNGDLPAIRNRRITQVD